MSGDSETEHHARLYLWALLEALPEGASLVFSRTGAQTCQGVLLRPGAYEVRGKAATWEEATRRLARQASIELAQRKRSE